MPSAFPVTEHVVKTDRHTTFHLACGAADAQPVILVHGWPELSISWRHQLPFLAALGYRAIAPDMRGYGRSSVYGRHEDYALEHTVADMLELLTALGHERAIWVGHDWGSPVVWSLASHHPERCHAVANLCVPYFPDGFCPESFLPLVDRNLYPADSHPAGQWDYQLFYEESFDKARAAFEGNVGNTVKALFRRGTAESVGKPSRTSDVRRRGGWFNGGSAPDLPMDTSVLTPEDWHAYTAALTRNGFFGPDSWYMNHRRNASYAKQAKNAGRLEVPVLFLHGAYDVTCETMTSRLTEPMRAKCADLTEVVVKSGHWMAQERPTDVNAALAGWLARSTPHLWPTQSRPGSA